MNKAVQILDAAIQDRYCLHGSPVMGLKTIETRQASCASKNPNNCLTAVYADPLSIRRPIMHAVVHQLCPGGHSRRYSGDGKGLLLVKGKNVTLGFGSVYILRRDSFRWAGDEYVSDRAVPVVHEIIVSPKTVRAILVDLDLKISIPPPW